MGKKTRILIISGLVLASGLAWADAESAKAMATSVCANCHGPQGISPSDAFPNLAGQKKTYIVGALKAYRDKTRSNPIMSGMAAPLKDQDIDDLAGYFASLPCQ
jgi:cytochrome c553